MSDVNLPLSGPVEQWFRFLQSVFSTFTGQIGLINFYVGKSSNPAVEEQVVSDVAGYGKQLGRIEDALVVFLNHVELHRLGEDEAQAIDDLKRLLKDIADVRDRHSSKPVLRPRIDAPFQPYAVIDST